MPKTQFYAPPTAYKGVPNSLQHRTQTDQSLVPKSEVFFLIISFLGFDSGFLQNPNILNFVSGTEVSIGFFFFFFSFLLYRCREKQRKEASRLQTVNRKLTAMNRLLMEENDRLQKQVSQLVYENSYFRQQTQNVRIFFHAFEIIAHLKKMITGFILLFPPFELKKTFIIS